MPEDQVYMVTAWHKDGPANHRLEWHQSRMQVKEESDNYHEIAFEDTHTSDGFDDVIVAITIHDE